MLSNINFKPNKVEFKWDEIKKCFIHNFEDDYQIFVIWHKALEHEKYIHEKISKDFSIITSFVIHWSDSKYAENFKRLYKLGSNNSGEKEARNRGKGKFIIYLLKDSKPSYLYHTTFSGKTEIVNKNIINLKENIREHLNENLVHSSNNIKEFFRDATLFLGPYLLQKVLKNEIVENKVPLHQDLVGAESWKDFSELFSAMNYSIDYVVLRNFEFLPNNFFANDKDVDLLLDNQNDFLFFANTSMPRIKKSGTAACKININGTNVPFDAITLGDDYYDYNWQCNILKNRSEIRNIQVPRCDDYFFSLLYHAKLQKPFLKDNYLKILTKHAELLGLSLSKEDIIDDQSSARILINFLISNGYFVPKPKKKSKYINQKFLKIMMNNKKYKKIMRERMLRKMIYIVERIPFGFRIFKKSVSFYLLLRKYK